WLNPLFRKGYARQLEVDDLYNVVAEDQSDTLGDKLEKEWAKEVKKSGAGRGKPSLFWALFRMFGLEYILFGLLLLCEEATKVVQPLLLGGLIRYFTPGSEVTKAESLLYAGGVSLCALILAISHHPFFFGVQRIGMKMRLACCSVMYRKVLRLSEGLAVTTKGQIVNLMSNDVKRFDRGLMYLHYLWVGPLQAIAILVIVWREFGLSTLAGFVVLLLLVPVQGWMGKLISKFREEIVMIWKKRILSAISTCNWVVGPRLMYFVVIVTTALVQGPGSLRASVMYVVVPLLFVLAQVMMGVINLTIEGMQEVRLPCTRCSGSNEQNVMPAECKVIIDNVSAKWNQELEQPTLKNVSAKVEAGKLLAVIGPIGAGKSSLLMAVLRELSISHGDVSVIGRVAYASQLPWVFSATLRQNITLGNKYEIEKFERILEACALDEARLSLARALYMDADVYLLDDPLSAVDTAVGRHIFQRVVQGYLKKKPRILVTHQLQFVKEADQIVIIEEGEMIGKGTFHELSNSGIDFSSLLKHKGDKSDDPQSTPHDLMNEGACSGHSLHESIRDSLDSIGAKRDDKEGQLLKEEERHEGTVGFNVYIAYFKAGAGLLKFLLLVFLCLAAQGSNLEEALYAAIEKHASLVAEGYNATNVTIPTMDTNFNIAVFGGILGAVFLFGILRALMFFKVAVDASQTLHKTMFNSILRSHMQFFDNNPVGRILNRFSKDIGNMDDILPITFFDFTQEKFIEEFDAHQDMHTESWFLCLTSSRWLATRLDWLCALFVTAVSFSCVLSADCEYINRFLTYPLNAGLVGLSMTYAMTLMSMFQWGVKQSAEVENQMISVERVLDYTMLPSEAALDSSDDHKPHPSWPQNGEISVKKACLKYYPEAPTVLKNLSFAIKAREKIGIVGRTGSGKSSLIEMFFRLVEPTGQITIDDVNVLEIGLHELRKNISIIPQDPVLFTGSVRRNLDPFRNHSDDALWEALGEVQLKPAIEELPKSLDAEVSEGGVNFSVGQRQLICLARAILRNNKILMIDEATANVDLRTDALIQRTIRDKFMDCTVLTIAHRLRTIMDSDRLLVLEDGKIVEFDAPYLLVTKPDGVFKRLVEQTGKEETAFLVREARNAFETRNNTSERRVANLREIYRRISEHDVSNLIEEEDKQAEENGNNVDDDETGQLLDQGEKVPMREKCKIIS
ncbi:MRP4-like protein, partial [Mya arenaria]